MAMIQTPTGELVLPDGLVLTSRVRRLLATLLDALLAIVTFGIGWLIWSLFTYRYGQTPGKQLMGIRVISLGDGLALGFWMTLLRELILKEFIVSLTFGIAYVWIFFDVKHQTLYDKILNTIVVDDPQRLTVREIQPATF